MTYLKKSGTFIMLFSGAVFIVYMVAYMLSPVTVSATQQTEQKIPGPQSSVAAECERLKTAIAQDKPGAIQDLIRKGARLDCVSGGKSPLDIVFTRKYKTSHGVGSMDSMINRIHSTYEGYEKRKEIEELIVDKFTTYLNPAVNVEHLKQAIVQSNLYLLKALLKKVPLQSGDVELKEKYNVKDITNPLLFAILVGRSQSVEVLLRAGADTRQRVKYTINVNGKKQIKDQNMFEFVQSLRGVKKGPLGPTNYKSVARVVSRHHTFNENEQKKMAAHQAQAVANEKTEKLTLARKAAAEENKRNKMWKQEVKGKLGAYTYLAKQVFLVSNSFVDDAVVANPSFLSCRTDLLRYYSDELWTLRERLLKSGSQVEKWSPDKSGLSTFLFGYEACREFDPRLVYWGLFVDGAATNWRQIDIKDAVELELSVIPEPCGSGVSSIVKLTVSSQDALLVVGVPDKVKVNTALYQYLGSATPSAEMVLSGNQTFILPTPRTENGLGHIKKATIVNHYSKWISDEPPLREQQVIDQATLFLEILDNGKTQGVQVFQDKGFGKYAYSNADIRDVHLLDADFDGDIDVLLTASNEAHYLILFDGDKPLGKPIALRRAKESMMIGGC